jgi:hypothetical protein
MSSKTKIKWWLARAGLWYPIDFVRRLPEVLRWARQGCSGVAPSPIKRMIVRSYLRSHALNDFVETGTYLGDTLAYIADSGTRCSSIELSDDLHAAATRRFTAYKNVRLLHGDSGEVLRRLLRDLNAPTLFWLDGHYSAGITATAQLQTPVSAELASILSHTIKQHVILIDDARCFDGTNDYPTLDALLAFVRNDGRYRAEISADIIRLVPAASP